MSEVSGAFLARMRERHADEIGAVGLPEGTDAHVTERIVRGDAATLSFMLKLAYLVGLHAGYAAQQEPSGTPPGPLQA